MKRRQELGLWWVHLLCPGYLSDSWKCFPIFLDQMSQLFLLWRFSVTARGKISAMFKTWAVMGSDFCFSVGLDHRLILSETECTTEICRWELWHQCWGRRAPLPSPDKLLQVQHSESQLLLWKTEQGFCRNPWMWPVWGSVPCLQSQIEAVLEGWLQSRISLVA